MLRGWGHHSSFIILMEKEPSWGSDIDLEIGSSVEGLERHGEEKAKLMRTTLCSRLQRSALSWSAKLAGWLTVRQERRLRTGSEGPDCPPTLTPRTLRYEQLADVF